MMTKKTLIPKMENNERKQIKKIRVRKKTMIDTIRFYFPKGKMVEKWWKNNKTSNDERHKVALKQNHIRAKTLTNANNF